MKLKLLALRLWRRVFHKKIHWSERKSWAGTMDQYNELLLGEMLDKDTVYLIVEEPPVPEPPVPEPFHPADLFKSGDGTFTTNGFQLTFKDGELVDAHKVVL